MSVVLDTTVLVDHLRGSSPAGEYIAALGAPPSCSEVTRVEILRGLRSEERRGAERLFALIIWVPVDEEVARRAGELGRRWRQSHPLVESERVLDIAVEPKAVRFEIGAIWAGREQVDGDVMCAVACYGKIERFR